MDNNDKGVKIFFIIMIVTMLPSFLTAVCVLIPLFPNPVLNPTWILVIILGIIITWIAVTYNGFVSLNQRVKQAQGGIDIYLKQRFDLIPNLVETVKGYAAYEKDLMENIAQLRHDYDLRNEQDITESQKLNDRYTSMIAMIEAYPELKADEAFLKLQKTLSKIESQLQAARRIYNSEVTEFNTKRYKFPSNLIAAIFGFKEKELFEIKGAEREKVNINI